MATISVISNSAWTIYNFRRGLINALQNYGFKVIVFTQSDAYSEKLRDEGIEVVDVNIEGQGRNPLNDLMLIIKFYKLFKKHKIDVSLNFTIKPVIYATVASNFSTVKVINNIAGLGNLFTDENWTTKIASMLYSYSQPKAKYVYFQNSEDKEMFLNRGFVNQNQIKSLPGSGINTNKFTYSFVEKAEPFIFLMQGRLLKDKGVEEYFEVAKQMKSKYGERVEFQILGLLNYNNPTSIKSNQMREWIDQGYINYLGRKDDVREVLQQVHCVVLPSYYREGVPRSLIEAAACGKVIITTNHPGCRDVVDADKNGYLVEPKNLTSLMQAVEKMFLLSKTDYKEMCLYSRNKAEKEFDEKIITDIYIQSINEILKKNTHV
jgi:glycosyltransferase involved in cell wall biosynthesis